MWTPETRALVGDYGSGQALSDEQYRLLEPLIPAAKPGGHPRTTDMRRLLDGLFYLVRTGCQWRYLPPPPAFPPWPTIVPIRGGPPTGSALDLPWILRAFFGAPVRTGSGVDDGDHHRCGAPPAVAE